MKQSIKGTPESAYEDILRSIRSNSIITIPVSERGGTVNHTYDLEALGTSGNNRGYEIEVSIDYEAKMLVKIRGASSGPGSTVRFSCKEKAPHIKKSDFDAILKNYVDFRRKQEGLDRESSELDSLREKLREAEGVIEKMVRRDAEIVLLRLKLQRSEMRVASLEKYIETMPAAVKEELQASGHIIKFPSQSGEADI